jgi:hypothetical protein
LVRVKGALPRTAVKAESLAGMVIIPAAHARCPPRYRVSVGKSIR